MKKLLLTILFTLVLSGGASAKEQQFDCKLKHRSDMYDYLIYSISNDKDYITIKYKWSDSFYNKNIGSTIKANTPIEGVLKKRIISNNGSSMLIQFEHHNVRFDYGIDGRVFNKKKIIMNCFKREMNFNNNTNLVEKNDIMFTIKDKREQCEAIGFKPETEKFADCVLRLVELDVKQQSQNQIAVAQNNGNDALVKQLKRQNEIQSSQALINLGQQLMNPKRYNSNIYMPQTQRCTIQGFGTFAKMVCR